MTFSPCPKPEKKPPKPRKFGSTIGYDPDYDMPKVNTRRRKRNHRKAYGPPGYVEWTQAQQCAACKVEGHSVVAHKRGSMGAKRSWKETLPLCETREERESFGRPAIVVEGCHAFQHRCGWKALALRSPGFDRDRACEIHQANWKRIFGGCLDV